MTALSGSSRGDACSLPTTWVSARPRRRLPPATPSGTPAASAVASSWSPPRSSRSGFASGSSSPTRPPPSIEGTPAQRRAAFEACRRGFLLGNYEQLIRDIDVVREWTPDIVVLDEAQRIKNWATKTALTVKRLDPPYRLVLTGTPMENRLDELASIVEWVDDLALEPKWRLAAWHTTPVDGKTEIGGARNLDTLRTRLATCMVRRVRQEVLSQLPARTDTRIPIEMTAEQMDEHDALNLPIAQILGRAKRRPLTQAEFLRLMTLLTTQRIIANGLAQLRFEQIWPDLSRIERPTDSTLRGLASPKLVELRELIGQLALAEGRKVVVFSQWRRMLRLAHWATRDQLAREGVRAAFFTGEEGQKRRTQNLVDFHDDPACRVLFATDAGGVGLNLQRAASACINIELPWNPAVLEQRIGRIYRLGQRRPIDVYNLVSEPGIESRIADLVGSKQALFTGLFDGTTDEVAFERSGSFLSRIERIVVPAISPAPARAEDVSVPEDDGAEREIEAVVAAGDESRDVAHRRDGGARAGGFGRRHPASCCRRDRAAHRQRRSGHRGAARNRVDVGSAVLRDGAAAPGRRDTAGHRQRSRSARSTTRVAHKSRRETVPTLPRGGFTRRTSATTPLFGAPQSVRRLRPARRPRIRSSTHGSAASLPAVAASSGARSPVPRRSSSTDRGRSCTSASPPRLAPRLLSDARRSGSSQTRAHKPSGSPR